MERKKGLGWRMVLLASHTHTHTQTDGSSSLLWSLLLSGAEVSGAEDEVEGRRGRTEEGGSEKVRNT